MEQRIIKNRHNGQQAILSESLLTRQDAWDNLEKIKELHLIRYEIEHSIEVEVDSVKLKQLAKDWTNNEFLLQDAWKFERNVNFHKWWNIKTCTCPKMDNDDSYPHGYYITNSGCKLHGI